jgi:hypothetical protein
MINLRLQLCNDFTLAISGHSGNFFRNDFTMGWKHGSERSRGWSCFELEALFIPSVKAASTKV